ncbi:unnamed protein product [Amoebophrya sp. A120]|nr:unnamed protein product [Amoebophrya sp. A120]|eukprot:GSA120T00010488001.1
MNEKMMPKIIKKKGSKASSSSKRNSSSASSPSGKTQSSEESSPSPSGKSQSNDVVSEKDSQTGEELDLQEDKATIASSDDVEEVEENVEDDDEVLPAEELVVDDIFDDGEDDSSCTPKSERALAEKTSFTEDQTHEAGVESAAAAAATLKRRKSVSSSPKKVVNTVAVQSSKTVSVAEDAPAATTQAELTPTMTAARRKPIIACRVWEPKPLSVEGIELHPEGTLTAVGRANGVVEIRDEFQFVRTVLYLPSIKDQARCFAWVPKVPSVVASTSSNGRADNDSNSSSDESSDDEPEKKTSKNTDKMNKALSRKGDEVSTSKKATVSTGKESTTSSAATTSSQEISQMKPNDYYLFVAGNHAKFHCYDVDSGEIVFSSDSFGGAVWSMSYVAAQDFLLLTCDDGCLKVFRRDEQQNDFSLSQSLNSQVKTKKKAPHASSHCVLQNGSVVLVGDTVGKVSKWTKDSATGRFVSAGVMRVNLPDESAKRKKTQGLAIISCMCRIDDTTFACGDSLGQVSFYDAKQCVLIQQFKKHDSEVSAVALNTNFRGSCSTTTASHIQKTVFSAGLDNKVQSYVLQDPEECLKTNLLKYIVGTAYFPPDCRHGLNSMVFIGKSNSLVYGGGNGSLYQTQLNTGVQMINESNPGGNNSTTDINANPQQLQFYMNPTRRVAGPYDGQYWTRNRIATSVSSSSSASATASASSSSSRGKNAASSAGAGDQHSQSSGSLLLCADVNVAHVWYLDFEEKECEEKVSAVAEQAGVLLAAGTTTAQKSNKRSGSSKAATALCKSCPDQPEIVPRKLFEIKLEDFKTRHLICSAVSKSGEWIALSNTTRTVVFHVDQAELKLTKHFTAENSPSTAVSFAGPNDRYLVCAKRGNKLEILDLETTAKCTRDDVGRWQLPSGSSTTGGLNGKSKISLLRSCREWLAVVDGSQQLTIYNLDTRSAHVRVPRMEGSVVDCVFDETKNTVSCLYSSNQFVKFDLDLMQIESKCDNVLSTKEQIEETLAVASRICKYSGILQHKAAGGVSAHAAGAVAADRARRQGAAGAEVVSEPPAGDGDREQEHDTQGNKKSCEKPQDKLVCWSSSGNMMVLTEQDEGQAPASEQEEPEDHTINQLPAKKRKKLLLSKKWKKLQQQNKEAVAAPSSRIVLKNIPASNHLQHVLHFGAVTANGAWIAVQVPDGVMKKTLSRATAAAAATAREQYGRK